MAWLADWYIKPHHGNKESCICKKNPHCQQFVRIQYLLYFILKKTNSFYVILKVDICEFNTTTYFIRISSNILMNQMQGTFHHTIIEHN